MGFQAKDQFDLTSWIDCIVLFRGPARHSNLPKGSTPTQIVYWNIQNEHCFRCL